MILKYKKGIISSDILSILNGIFPTVGKTFDENMTIKKQPTTRPRM